MSCSCNEFATILLAITNTNIAYQPNQSHLYTTHRTTRPLTGMLMQTQLPTLIISRAFFLHSLFPLYFRCTIFHLIYYASYVTFVVPKELYIEVYAMLYHYTTFLNLVFISYGQISGSKFHQNKLAYWLSLAITSTLLTAWVHRDSSCSNDGHWSFRKHYFLLHDSNHVPLQRPFLGSNSSWWNSGALDNTERFGQRDNLAFKEVMSNGKCWFALTPPPDLTFSRAQCKVFERALTDPSSNRNVPTICPSLSLLSVHSTSSEPCSSMRTSSSFPSFVSCAGSEAVDEDVIVIGINIGKKYRWERVLRTTRQSRWGRVLYASITDFSYVICGHTYVT